MRHKGYQVREPEEDILDKVESEINDWNIKVREALKKITGLFGNFSPHGGGGLPNSQNFCYFTIALKKP